MHRPEHLVALLSDLQPGLRTPTFNADIFEARLRQWASAIVRLREIHAAERDISKLYIACGGDFVEGYPDTRRINLAELDVIPEERRVLDTLGQKRLVQRLITEALVYLSGYFKAIEVIGVYGNHGANRSRTASARSNDDLEVYLGVADCNRNPSISFHIETDNFWTTFQVFNIRFLLAHGHQVTMWTRTPLYGIINKTVLWHQVLPAPFDAVLMGHFHNLNRLDAYGTPVYVNGCFGGDSEYEQARGLKATLAQWLIGVHPDYGIVWERRILFS